ncbi:hypothetical protein CGI24_24220 [Vibrio parahaemolyticus]|nr:hypothetical protein [Vibrio parahaemolyticus]TOK15333.1 hypothetical protein CGI24_24220 [Vibrio parahaemolyticus]
MVREKRANKAFKSDSQRLAVSLRSSIAKRRSHLNAALALRIKMHKIYENIYIGKFIFLLGVVSERQRLSSSEESNISIDLYQQTPADPKIGDFFSSLNGRNLIIEFKKDDQSLDSKELEKQSSLLDALTKKGDIELQKISYYSHFLGVGVNDGGNNADIEFQSYLPYQDFEHTSFSMKGFIDSYCKGENVNFLTKENRAIQSRIGSDSERFGEYLELLASLYKGGRSSSTGGLIVNISEDGRINCLSVPDVQNLVIKLSELNRNIERASPAPTLTPKNEMTSVFKPRGMG